MTESSTGIISVNYFANLQAIWSFLYTSTSETKHYPPEVVLERLSIFWKYSAVIGDLEMLGIYGGFAFIKTLFEDLLVAIVQSTYITWYVPHEVFFINRKNVVIPCIDDRQHLGSYKYCVYLFQLFVQLRNLWKTKILFRNWSSYRCVYCRGTHDFCCVCVCVWSILRCLQLFFKPLFSNTKWRYS